MIVDLFNFLCVRFDSICVWTCFSVDGVPQSAAGGFCCPGHPHYAPEALPDATHVHHGVIDLLQTGLSLSDAQKQNKKTAFNIVLPTKSPLYLNIMSMFCPFSSLAGLGRSLSSTLWFLLYWPSWPYREWPICRPSGRSSESSATCPRRSCWTGSRKTPVLVSDLAWFHRYRANNSIKQVLRLISSSPWLQHNILKYILLL